MKITEREEILMRRALDPASSPAEAEMAAQVFVRSLRKRGVSGYDFVRKSAPEASQCQQQRPSNTTPPPPKPEPEPQPKTWSDQSHSYYGSYQNASEAKKDTKWDFMREQRARAYEEAAQDVPSQPRTPRQPAQQEDNSGWVNWVYRIVFFFTLIATKNIFAAFILTAMVFVVIAILTVICRAIAGRIRNFT
jgi:hypothetical protein